MLKVQEDGLAYSGDVLCVTCGEEHPTLKHEKAVSMRKIKAEQASSDTKVNISSLYGNGRK